MKKLLFLVCLAFLSYFTYAQEGMDGVIVERYYVANSADHAYDANLPVGAVTYRIYLDLKDGWQLQSYGGDPDNNREFRIQTTTSFYNNTEDGAAWGDAITRTKLSSGLLMLDSWLSMGPAAKKATVSGTSTYYYGILKAEDNGANTVVNSNGVLQNNDVKAGIPLTTQDGIIASATVVAPTIANIGIDDLIAMLDGSSSANTFASVNGAAYTVSNCVGPNSDNKILIGQFTTDGVFTFKMQVQIRRIADFKVEKYVCENVNGQSNTYLLPALGQTLGAPATPPTVSGLTVNPSSVTIGSNVNISVTATDNVSVDKVEFYLGNTKIGEDATSPYELSYTTNSVGTFNVTAVAIDNEGSTTTSSPVVLTVNAVPANVAPVVTGLTVDNSLPVNVGATVTGSATATDSDGSVARIEFFLGSTSLGVDATAPYTFSFPASAEGTYTIRAIATDNQGAVSSARTISVNVVDPAGPKYTLVSDTLSCLESDFFYMPVVRTRSSLSNVIGFDMVLNYDKTKVKPTGFIKINNDLISDSLLTSYHVDIKDGKMNISLYLNGNAPENTYFHGLGQVMAVEFNKTSGFGSSDRTSFSSDSLVESYNTGIKKEAVKPGTFTSVKDSIFTGSLKFWTDNSPIAFETGKNLITRVYGSDANCNKTAYFVTPDAKGIFKFDINKAQRINIDRDIPGTKDVMSVISGYDAMLTKKVLVDDASFIPSIFQMIAMDVNTDGVVSAGDLSQINQRTAKVIDEFKQKWNYNDDGTKKSGYAPSKDWVFIDNNTLLTNAAYRKSNTYPNNDNSGYSKWKVPVVAHCVGLPVSNLSSCPVIESEEYQGVLLGDVNGNYRNLSPDIELKSATEESENVLFDMSKASVSDGYLIVPVSVTADYDINSLDFGMTFDNQKLTFKSVINNVDYLQSLAYYNEDDETLRLTSYSLESYEQGKAVMSLKFKMNSQDVSSDVITSVKAYVNENPSTVQISEYILLGIPEQINDLIRVYPNPAGNVIYIDLPEKAAVQLVDISGKVVANEPEMQADHKNSINISSLSDGVYLMKIYTNNGVAMRKVVVKK